MICKTCFPAIIKHCISGAAGGISDLITCKLPDSCMEAYVKCSLINTRLIKNAWIKLKLFASGVLTSLVCCCHSRCLGSVSEQQPCCLCLQCLRWSTSTFLQSALAFFIPCSSAFLCALEVRT